MKLYLDDDCVEALLAKLLKKAGHDVQIPADIEMSGDKDSAQMLHAVKQGRVVLTKNYDDFWLLHQLVLATGGHHPGVFIVREDNDPRRDLTARGIVLAIANLIASGNAIANDYHILNQWR